MLTVILDALEKYDDYKVMVLPDHPTPCKHRTHTAEPVPFLVWHPGITPDSVSTFDEEAAKTGSYGLLQRDEFINAFMNN